MRMAREDLQQVISYFLEAFNGADWPRYREIVADDARYQQWGGERLADDRTGGLVILRRYKVGVPGLEIQPITWVVDEVNSTVAVEVIWQRTDTDDQRMVSGTFFFKVQGGRVTHIREQHLWPWPSNCPWCYQPHIPPEVLSALGE
jgi:hypothetical protein